MNTIRLNLGCGSDILDGWVNIDLYPIDRRVVKMDVRSIDFSPGTISEIRAIDVFEHIPRLESEAAFAHWTNLLVRGGRLTLRTPDARRQCELLVEGIWPISVWSHMMFGGQDSPGNFHFNGHEAASLRALAERHGLKVNFVDRIEENITGDAATSFNVNLLMEAIKA